MELEKYKEKVFLSIVDGFLKISSSAEDNNLCLAEIERILKGLDEEELVRMTTIGLYEKIIAMVVHNLSTISKSIGSYNLFLAEIERILNVSDEQELIRMTSVGFCCDILVNL